MNQELFQELRANKIPIKDKFKEVNFEKNREKMDQLIKDSNMENRVCKSLKEANEKLMATINKIQEERINLIHQNNNSAQVIRFLEEKLEESNRAQEKINEDLMVGALKSLNNKYSQFWFIYFC